MKMATQKRVFVPASSENILQSHVGVIIITLCGVAALLGTLGICMYGYVKFRRAKKDKLDKELEHEGMKESIIHLAKVKTDGSTSERSKSSEETLPRRPISLGNDYGMVGFGNCRTSYMESIAGSSSAVLPGDVVLPENGASTARTIRDTSAVLTPPMTLDRCKLPSIQHWNQPIERCLGLSEPLKIGNTTLLEIPIPRPLTINKEDKELPGLPVNRGGEIRGWEKFDAPVFGAVKRASMRRRARSRNESWDSPKDNNRQGVGTSSLRKFGELEARKGSARTKKEKYRKRRSTDSSKLPEGLLFPQSPSYETVNLGSDAVTEVTGPEETNLGHDGYSVSLIEAYRCEETENSENGEENYLWKPLPKPPVENGWPLGRAEMA
ncbi:hypothetical protein TWF718_002106 [Orbilia javanica]|uniref:Uncharacterized protein n=1 Tax=Orbilia javanica TaxID=47235 RepID=A0AAN8NLP6_9PEZI